VKEEEGKSQRIRREECREKRGGVKEEGKSQRIRREECREKKGRVKEEGRVNE